MLVNFYLNFLFVNCISITKKIDMIKKQQLNIYIDLYIVRHSALTHSKNSHNKKTKFFQYIYKLIIIKTEYDL